MTVCGVVGYCSPTDPRFWIALWGLVIAGVVGLVALAIAKELVDQELEADPFGEPWGDC